jgi:two-component system nitrate/nitrite sensor histidine kinase NarX
MKSIKLEDGQDILENMQNHFLDTSDPEIVWMLRQHDPIIVDAVSKVELLQVQLIQIANFNVRLTAQLRMIEKLAKAYDDLYIALQKDAEIKRSVIALLQLVSIIFVITCLIILAWHAKKLMVDRLGGLVSHIDSNYPSASFEQRRPNIDEFNQLEQRVVEMIVLIKTSEAEFGWADHVNNRIKSLNRAQHFLLEFIETVSNDILSDQLLLKMLYSLERTMNFYNAALIYTDDASVVSSEKVLYSNHKPNLINNSIFNELMINGVVNFEQKQGETLLRYIALSFSGPTNGMGILLIEMDETRLLDDSETKVLEMTIKLLSMISKFQSHDEEGRRLAVLEERAAIARELHDSLAQSLSYMKIQVARLKSSNSSQKQESVVKELREGLDNAYRELRELLRTFRVHLDLRGLGYAIQTAIDEFTQRSHLLITLDNRLINYRLTVNEEFHILHVIREALSNIVRHSGAKNVTILMLLKPDGRIELTIDDDGVGIVTNSTSEPDDHHGQIIMRERAKTLGGEIQVMPRRSGGTRVQLSFMPKLAQ